MIYHGANGFNDLPQTVHRAVTDIGPVRARFDCLVVTGVSGLSVGSPVALALSVPLVYLRKPGDSHHGYNLVENLQSKGTRFLFLDDFIQDGDTIHRVLRHFNSMGLKHAGTYLYARRILRMGPYKVSVRNSMPLCR